MLFRSGDIGTQYRSAIFTTSTAQHDAAIATRAIYQSELTRAGLDEIVTEIIGADSHPYYVAEEYHQKYLEKNPNGYDCHSSTGIAFPKASEQTA